MRDVTTSASWTVPRETDSNSMALVGPLTSLRLALGAVHVHPLNIRIFWSIPAFFNGSTYPAPCNEHPPQTPAGLPTIQVIVWSPQSRRPLATLKSHASAVHGIAVDPGTHSGDAPRWIASGGGEGFLLVWDPRNFRSPVATLRGEAAAATDPSSLSEAFSSGVSVVEREGSLQGGLAGARSRGESGRWEGETTGATMLNAVNCLAAGGAGSGGDWLFAAGETVVRSWRRRDGVWRGGAGLPGEGLGGIASLSVIE